MRHKAALCMVSETMDLFQSQSHCSSILKFSMFYTFDMGELQFSSTGAGNRGSHYYYTTTAGFFSFQSAIIFLSAKFGVSFLCAPIFAPLTGSSWLVRNHFWISCFS